MASFSTIATSDLFASDFSPELCSHTSDEAFTLLRGLKLLLEQHHFSLSDVYYVYCTLSDLSDFVTFNTVYKSFFCAPNPPARCCIECNSQPFRVKISVKGTKNTLKSALHVQSVSCWAPANIGPYSQAIQIGNKLHMSGGIGLIPGEMQLCTEEMPQCVANLREICTVMDFDLVNSELTVVYYVGEKPDFPSNFEPFYVKVTKIPKNGKIEVEMHLKKSLPHMKSVDLTMETEGFSVVIQKKCCFDVIFALFRIEVVRCTDISAFLHTLKTHFDDYFAEIPSKSPTKASDLLSISPLATTILDYITEIRITGPNPYIFDQLWVKSVPAMFTFSEKSSILVKFEDRLQLATYDFLHEDRNS